MAAPAKSAVRRPGLALGIVAALILPGAARAATLTVQVTDKLGRPVAESVVLVRPAAGRQDAGPVRFRWPLVMRQRNIAFDPHTLIVPVGSVVTFPNHDSVRHHVYSFSPAKRFELKLYGKEEQRSVTFDKPGPITMGCNIHDKMSAFIYVSDTRYVGLTGAGGSATIENVPAGPVTVTIWHPYQKGKGNSLDRQLSIRGDLTQTIVIDVREGRPS